MKKIPRKQYTGHQPSGSAKKPKAEVETRILFDHFQHSRDLLFTIDRHLKFRAVSPSMEKILGYNPDDFIDGRITLGRILPARQAAGLRRLFRAALASRETGPVICEAKTKDGGIRVLEFVAGRPSGRIGDRLLTVSARDITEWQRIAEALRQSEGKYRALVESTETGYVILDSNGRVLDANQEYIRLTGRRSLKAILGRHMAEWTAEYDRERIRSEVHKCLRRRSVRMLEVDYAHPDGTVVPVEINATVVEGETGPQIISVVRDISERRDIERSLRESERQLRTLVQNQGEGVGIVDQSERFIFANPAAEEIFGVPAGGLIGHSLKEFAPPGQYAEMAPQTSLRRQGIKSTYQIEIVRRDGQRRQLLITATPQMDHGGGFTGTFGVFRDITEWKRTEEALRKSEQRYRTLVETSPDAIIVSDLEGKVVAANQRAADMHGVAGSEQLLGMDVYEFIVPEDRARAAENAKRTLRLQSVHDIEYRMLRRDGSRFEAELTASTILGPAGRPAGFMAVVRDITERKKVETALRESEERYRLLAEYSNEVVFMTDLKNRFTYISPSIQRLQGFTVEEAMSLGMEGLVAPSSLELLRTIHREGARVLQQAHPPGPLSQTVDMECRHKLGGTIWCEVTAMVLTDGQGRPASILGVLRDITERKRVEQALKESQERYRRFFQDDLSGDYLSTPEGKLLDCNPAFAAMLGFGSVEEAMQTDTRELYFHPEQRRGFLKRLQEQGKLISEETLLKRRDGETITVIENIVGELDQQGRLTSFRGYMFDITERKKAEQSLRQSEEKYRALFNQASDGILLMPVDGSRLTVNQSFARMHGYNSPEEMANLRLEDLETPESARLSKGRLERMLAGEHLQFEVEHYHRNGHHFPLRVSSSLVRIGESLYFLGFHQDITEHKRLEKEVLEVGDRVQYQIGHDLHDGVNQMLTSTSLRIGALKQKLREGRLPGEEEILALADLNRQTMEQVSALARGLSPLSIKQGGLAMGLAELGKTTSTLGVECRASLDETLIIDDLAVATHLYRIAQEAVNNALKHAEPSAIEIVLRYEKDKGLLSVTDDGRGLPQDGPVSGGMGLNIMRYRAGIIGAELDILPGRKKGTEVRCLFRIPKSEK